MNDDTPALEAIPDIKRKNTAASSSSSINKSSNNVLVEALSTTLTSKITAIYPIEIDNFT